MSAASWLPRGFEFLSGLPEQQRKRRLLMVIQAFVDDSGVQDGRSTWLTLAALVSTSRKWADFSDAWKVALHASPAIDYFKMQQAAALSGQFRHFTAEARDKKLLSLAEVINCYVQAWTAAATDLAEYERFKTETESVRPDLDPYVIPFQHVIWAVALSLRGPLALRRFEVIFDEQVTYGFRAKAWYPAMQHIWRMENAAAAAIMPIEPVFRSDNEFLPLQAADMFAYCARLGCQDPYKPHPFQWLIEAMPRTRLLANAFKFEGQWNARLIKQLSDYRKGLLPREQMEAFRAFFEASQHLQKPKPPRKKPRKKAEK